MRFNYWNATPRKKFPAKLKWQSPGMARRDEVFQHGLKGRLPQRAAPLRVQSWLELLRLWPFCVLLVEAQMTVVRGRELPANKEIFDIGGQLERVAVGHDEIGEFAPFEGSDLIVEAENPRGIKRYGLERFLIRQAVRDGVRGVLSQSPREGIVEAGDGKLHAAGGKDHPQPLLVAKLDRVANLARAIGENQQRQFAANDRHKRLELQVAIVF